MYGTTHSSRFIGKTGIMAHKNKAGKPETGPDSLPCNLL